MVYRKDGGQDLEDAAEDRHQEEEVDAAAVEALLEVFEDMVAEWGGEYKNMISKKE